ncbi:MAG TPA: biotin synthase, partial [Archangium sp.]
PGLGVRTVDRLLRIRKWHRLTLEDLARLKVPLARVKPFIVTADHRPTALLDSPRLPERVRLSAEQLSLFSTAVVARTGEL